MDYFKQKDACLKAVERLTRENCNEVYRMVSIVGEGGGTFYAVTNFGVIVEIYPWRANA